MLIAPVAASREALAHALRASGAVNVVHAVGFEDVSSDMIAGAAAVVILVEVRTTDALQLLCTVAEAASQLVVAFGIPHQSEVLVACAQCGADGLIEEEASLVELEDAVLATARVGSVCTPRLAGELASYVASLAPGVSSAASWALTVREREVAHLVAKGLTNKEIAQTLSIAVSTVKVHVHNVLDKLQLVIVDRSRRSSPPGRSPN